MWMPERNQLGEDSYNDMLIYKANGVYILLL